MSVKCFWSFLLGIIFSAKHSLVGIKKPTGWYKDGIMSLGIYTRIILNLEELECGEESGSFENLRGFLLPPVVFSCCLLGVMYFMLHCKTFKCLHHVE